MKSLPSLAKLLLLPQQLLSGDSCLSNSYYGSYRDGNALHSVVIPDHDCFTSAVHTADVTVVNMAQEVEQLVWLEHVAIDPALQAQSSNFDAVLALLGSGSNDQIILSARPSYNILYQSQVAALVSFSPNTARVIDTLLPPFWRSTLLPTSPIDFLEVSPLYTQHVENIVSSLKFDPVIADIVDAISVPHLRNDIRYLSGEDPNSPIVSRHSFAEGSRLAADWLKARFEETGVTCELRSFLEGFAPNVICRYPALLNTTGTILISGHYDSRGSFGSLRAPGADDDGSGTVALLSIARAIHQKGVKFQSNVELVAFAGEEQGLVGSKAYARELRGLSANLTFAIQADMLAYRVPGEPMQLGIPDIVNTPAVSQLVANVSALYSPELIVGTTTACCSDHQSFIMNGFPAAQLFERNGPIADPMYHNSGDLSERVGYDFEQLKAIAKVQLATILHAAGFEVPT